MSKLIPLGGLSLVVVLSFGLTAGHAANAADAGTLRVCASTIAAPYSLQDGSGFENKIATAVARAMGRKVQFVWSQRPAIYAVTEQLGNNLCDVVFGVDSDDARVLATKPVYRAGYVFITRAKDPDIKDFQDPRLKTMTHIAMPFHSPAQPMLEKIGTYDNNMAYLYSLIGFRSPRNEYVDVAPDKIVSEVAAGTAELGIAFEPEIARYVKASSVKLRVTLIPDNAKRSDGKPVPQHYNQAIGVRKRDTALLAELDKAIVKAQPQIDAILKDEGFKALPANS